MWLAREHRWVDTRGHTAANASCQHMYPDTAPLAHACTLCHVIRSRRTTSSHTTNPCCHLVITTSKYLSLSLCARLASQNMHPDPQTARQYKEVPKLQLLPFEE